MVGGHGHGHAGFAQLRDGRQVRVAQRVVGAGQQHGHGAGGLHGGDAVLRQVLDVVARQRTVARGQGRAAHVRELLGMQFDGDAELLRSLKHLLRFGQREGNAFAEHVHRIDQAFGRERGQHLVADQVGVVLAAAGVFGRQRMRAEEGGAHRDAEGCAQAAGHAQLLALVLQRQAVAGLDLDGADAFVEQGLQAGSCEGKEFVLGRLARGLDGRHDAAAGLGHFFVRGARQPHGEFVGPLAAIDEVGVAVHQAGRGQGAAGIVAGEVCVGGGQRGGGAYPAHRASLHHHAGRRSGRQRCIEHSEFGHRAQVVPDAVGAGGWKLGHGYYVFDSY